MHYQRQARAQNSTQLVFCCENTLYHTLRSAQLKASIFSCVLVGLDRNSVLASPTLPATCVPWRYTDGAIHIHTIDHQRSTAIPCSPTAQATASHTAECARHAPLVQAPASDSHADTVSKVASVRHARHRHELLPRWRLHSRHVLHKIVIRDAHVTKDEPLTQRSVLAATHLPRVAEESDAVQVGVRVEHDLGSKSGGLGGSPALTRGELTKLGEEAIDEPVELVEPRRGAPDGACYAVGHVHGSTCMMSQGGCADGRKAQRPGKMWCFACRHALL